MRGQLFALSLAVTLAGCAAPPAESAATYDVDRCEVAPARQLIGKSWTLATEAKAIMLSGAALARTIRPGQPVTSEHFTSRINLILNPAEQIVEVRCG